MKRILIIIVWTTLICKAWPAVNYSGFLADGVGAEAMSLGGAYTAISNSNSAIFWNSAGLTQIEDTQITSLYSKRFGDVDHYWVGAHTRTQWGHIGAGLVSSRIQDMVQTSATGEQLSLFNFSDTAFMTSFARPISDQLSLGVTAKAVQQKAIESNAGLGLDLAVLYRHNNLRLGLNFQDWIATKIGPDKMARRTLIGAAYHFNKLTLSSDIHHIQTQGLEWAVGAQGHLLEMLTVHAGLNRSKLNLGAGLTLGSIQLDYHFRHHELGNLHQVEFGFAFLD